MEVETSMLGEPGHDRRCFVSGAVVHDKVDVERRIVMFHRTLRLFGPQLGLSPILVEFPLACASTALLQARPAFSVSDLEGSYLRLPSAATL